MLNTLGQFATEIGLTVAFLMLLVELITRPRLLLKFATAAVRFLKREWRKLREAFVELRDEVTHWDNPGSNPPPSAPTEDR